MRLGHGAAQIAPAHAEFDRNEPFAAFVINPGRAGVQSDGRQFLQWNVGIGTAAGLIGHLDVANFFDAVAVFRRITDGQAELPVSFQNRGRHRSAERRLDDRVHVAGIKAVARGVGAVHRDVQVRLAEHRKRAEVGDAANLAHLVLDLTRPASSSVSRLGPAILTELAPLTPEIASSMLS